MPVTTRSMKKNLYAAKPISAATPVTAPKPISTATSVTAPKPMSATPALLSAVESYFVQQTKNLLFQCQFAQGKEAKMRISLQIYKDVNAYIERLLVGNQMKWVRFAATVYSKATEFYNQMIAGVFNDISDKTLVAIFIQELTKARKFLETYFINLKKLSLSHIDMNDRFIDSAMREIEKNMASSRPRRSVPRVNYTGMDTIEPESEFDGITDIWLDLTVYEDPDYVPEEDEEDDDDDEDDEDETVEVVVQHSQPVTRRRIGRNPNPQNYAGMDMCEDDKGSVSVNVVKWINRVPTYKWVKYPLSQVNELFDEEWTPSCGV